jgi:hypothetical protein
MKIIYKYLNKYKEIIYISLVLISIIIILKLFKKNNIIEGHEPHSFSKASKRGCSEIDLDVNDYSDLLKKYEKIQMKCYKINLYNQTFMEMVQNGDIKWSNELVMSYLQSDHVDGPEYLLIEKINGLYDLILDYANEYEKKLKDLQDKGKITNSQTLEDYTVYIPTVDIIMQKMEMSELDVGEILYTSYNKGTSEFKRLVTEDSYITTFKSNKRGRWNKRNKTYIGDGTSAFNRWKDKNEWVTSAYEKYSSSNQQSSFSIATCDDITKLDDECQMCDLNEQIACYKKKWIDYQTMNVDKTKEITELENQYKILQEEYLDSQAAAAAELLAAQNSHAHRVKDCNSLAGYAEDLPKGNLGGDKFEAEDTGITWCSMKTDNNGNTCQFNKVKQAKRARRKDGIKWKIYCTA